MNPGAHHILKPLGDWITEAACAEMPTEMFYTSSGGAPNKKQTKVAHSREMPAFETCNSCPVKQECLLAGLDESGGIWGGATADDRRRLKFARQTKGLGAYEREAERHFVRLYGRVTRYRKGEHRLCPICTGDHPMIECSEVA